MKTKKLGEKSSFLKYNYIFKYQKNRVLKTIYVILSLF